MSETMSWVDRVKKGARRYPYRPYENNERSYKDLRDTYGFEFDEYLCPIRGKDRNYMIGTFGQEGWWTFWFPTHAEKNNQFHPLREWGDGIAAAVKPRGKAAYELSWSMNVLPFLPEGALELSGILNEWFVQSSAKNFSTDFADLWRKQMRAAVSNLSAIVTWSRDGTQTFDIKSDDAVQTIDQALEILGLGKPAEQPEEADVSKVTDLVKEKTGADGPFPEPHVGGMAAAIRDKVPQEKPVAGPKVIDFGPAANIFPVRVPVQEGRMYDVAPPLEVIQDWGIPDEGVTFFVRPDGAGRLRIYEGNKADLAESRVQDMDRHPVSFRGAASKFRWRKKKRRAVAQFTAAQVQVIIG